jgi:hypothetical protein
MIQEIKLNGLKFCPTIHSAANPIYESLKYLDEDDTILDYSDDK